MNVSSISDNSSFTRKNYTNDNSNAVMDTKNAMSNPLKKPPVPDETEKDKPKGIETLTTFSIYPKQVINGRTIITA